MEIWRWEACPSYLTRTQLNTVKWGNVNTENHHHLHNSRGQKEQQIAGDEGRTCLPLHHVSIIASECTTTQKIKSLALGQVTKGKNPKGANSCPMLLFSRKGKGESVLNKHGVWLQLWQLTLSFGWFTHLGMNGTRISICAPSQHEPDSRARGKQRATPQHWSLWDKKVSSETFWSLGVPI